MDDHKDDIRAIHAAIDRMRAFTPAEPHSITIHQDVEPRYHHTYAWQQRQWLEHTPFEQSEPEWMQYQTFVYHEPGKSMYTLRNNQPVAKIDSNQKACTGANTPSAAPKRKITFDAYKKKLNGGTPDSKQSKTDEQLARKPAAKGPVKGPIERIKIDEEVLASLVGDDIEDIATPTEVKKELKRKRVEDGDQEKGEGEAQKMQKKQDASPKKERLPELKEVKMPYGSDKAQNAESKTDSKSSLPAAQTIRPEQVPPSEGAIEDERMRLPPKLSPPRVSVEEEEDTRLPPKLSPPSPPSPLSIPPLPPKLSPTIPDNIARTLKARGHYRNASRSSGVSASDRNLTPPQDGKNGILKKSPRNGFRANSSSPAIRSDVEERGRPVLPVPADIRAVDPGADSADEIVVAKTKMPTTNGPPKLVVRLKFKKAARETVRRILKMKPKPQKNTTANESKDDLKRQPSVSDARHREQREAGTKGVAQKVGPARRANGEIKTMAETKGPEKEHKRVRTAESDSDERPAKRKKPVESPELRKERPPSTPDKQGISSPSAVQKATTTPGNMRKDLLSVSMKRERSNDSNMNTPSAVSQSSPPDTTAPGAQANGTTKLPATKTTKQTAWETEQKRFEVLGRELKHAAEAHLRAVPPSSSTTVSTTSTTDNKLAAVKSVESILAYLAAFDCADKAASAAEPRLPSSRNWRSMQGFYVHVTRRCEAFPVLHGIACWLGVVFNAHILKLANVKDSIEVITREVLLKTTDIMFRAAQDAEGNLHGTKIQAVLPRSWQGQAKGGYALPISMTTSPLAAAKSGCAMLREWAEREELGYELKIEVGKTAVMPAM